MSDYFEEFCFVAVFPNLEIRDQVLERFKSEAEISGIDVGATELEGRPALQFEDAEGHPTTDALAKFLQSELQRHELDDVIAFEWAGISMPHEPEGFGGGAVAISRHGVIARNSSEWLNDASQALRAGGRNNSLAVGASEREG